MCNFLAAVADSVAAGAKDAADQRNDSYWYSNCYSLIKVYIYMSVCVCV